MARISLKAGLIQATATSNSTRHRDKDKGKKKAKNLSQDRLMQQEQSGKTPVS